MSKPIDQERAIFENWYLSLPYGSPNFYDLRELADGSYKFASVRQLWDCWQARASVQPAGVVVPDAAGAMVKISAALCTVALREIENAMDSPRLSRGRLENALAACKDRLGGYAIDLRRASAPHPVSGEQKPIQRRYPDWGLVRQSSSAISIVQGATYVTFREGEDDKRMPWLVDFLSSLLAGNDPSPRAEQDMFELRLCEQKHTVLKPGVAYLFTFDPNCAACVELDSAHRAQQGEQP